MDPARPDDGWSRRPDDRCGSITTLAVGTSEGESTRVKDSFRVLSWATFAIAGAAFVGALSGCAKSPVVSMAEGPRAYDGSEYGAVMDRWTRTHSLIRLPTVDDRLTVTSTYESWDFRWSYVMRYARDYRLSAEERQAMLDKTLLETQSTHRFQVALYGNLPPRMTDLSRPNCAWVVRLVDDQGNETAPTRIEQVLRPTAIDKAYFPYLSVWRQIFKVDFPKSKADGSPTLAKNAKWIGLAFSGAYGHDEIRWALTEEGEGTRRAAMR